MLFTINYIDTLSTLPRTLWKFDPTLLEINLKFALGSLSSILDALVNCFSSKFNYRKIPCVSNKRTLKHSSAHSNLICPLNS